MERVPIRKLRTHLASTLDKVRRGEQIIVVKRGVPVARIVRAGPVPPLERKLDLLAAKGLLRRGAGRRSPLGEKFSGFDLFKGRGLAAQVERDRR